MHAKEIGSLPLFTGALLVFALGLTSQAANGQLALGIGGPQSEQGNAVAVDKDGNIFVTGDFNNTVDFDLGPGVSELTASGEYVFVASYDKEGELRFVNSFPGTGRGIAVDNNGNVFATGLWGGGMIDVDPGPGETLLDSANGTAFVVSYDSTGAIRFGFSVGGGSIGRTGGGNAISVNSSGTIFVTGFFFETGDFDPDSGVALLESKGITDAFVASYTNSGGFRWAISFGGIGSDDGLGIAASDDGTTYVTGSFRDSVDFDPGQGEELRTTSLNRAIFLASYEDGGDFRYAVTSGGRFDDFGNAVAIDQEGNAFVTGALGDSADFDPGPGELYLKPIGGVDMFVASYTTSGDLRWAFTAGNANPVQGTGIAVDPLGLVYVTGIFRSTMDLDPGPDEANVERGGPDAFVASYDNDGNYRYGFSVIGTTNSSAGRGIAVDSSLVPTVVGNFSGTRDFNPGPDVFSLTSNGSIDVFVSNLTVSSVGIELPELNERSLAVSHAFPNPSMGPSHVELTVEETQAVVASLYDLLGRKVKVLHDGLVAAGDRQLLRFDTSALPAGLYILNVAGAHHSLQRTIIVAR